MIKSDLEKLSKSELIALLLEQDEKKYAPTLMVDGVRVEVGDIIIMKKPKPGDITGLDDDHNIYHPAAPAKRQRGYSIEARFLTAEMDTFPKQLRTH